jgi:hypothetical protein
MLDLYLKDEAAVQRMRALPVGAHVDAFAAVLSALGYARDSVRDRLWTLAALGRWLKRRGLSVIDLRPDMVAAFLRPRTQHARVHRGAAATLRLFLEYLDQATVIPPTPSSSPTPIARLKARYEAHLHHDRRLSPVTGSRHWFVLGRFLRQRFGTGAIEPRAITVEDVTRYVTEQIPARSPASAQLQCIHAPLLFPVSVADRANGRRSDGGDSTGPALATGRCAEVPDAGRRAAGARRVSSRLGGRAARLRHCAAAGAAGSARW